MLSRGLLRLSLVLPDGPTTVTITTSDASRPALLGSALLTGFDVACRRAGPRSLLHVTNAILAAFHDLTATLEIPVEVKTAVDPRHLAPVRWAAQGFAHVYLIDLTATPGIRELTRHVRLEQAVPSMVDPGIRWAVTAANPQALHALTDADVRVVNQLRARSHARRYESSKKAPAPPLIAAPVPLPTFPSGMVPGDVEAFACRPRAMAV